MSKCCKIIDGRIVKYNCEKPKVIIGSDESIYLPIEDNKPTLGEHQTISGITYNVEADKVVKVYDIYTKPSKDILQDAKDKKCEEIDSDTRDKIVDLIGNDISQRNKTAKSSQLILKKIDGTITTEETTLLESFNNEFAQVEQWQLDGNAKEKQVQLLETIEEVKSYN